MQRIIPKKIPGFLWAVILAIFIELTVCQYGFYFSLNNVPVEECNVEIYNGGEWNGDGSITVTDTLHLKISDIQQEVKWLHFNFRRFSAEGIEDVDGTMIVPHAIDEANADYFVMPERMVLADNVRSQYMRLHLSGECDSILIRFYASEGDVIFLEDVVVNPHVPMNLSFMRFVLIYATICVIYYCHPKKKYYETLCGTQKKQKGITMAIMVVQIAVFVGAIFLNPTIYQPEFRHHSQYHELAVAISKGQLYLEEMPPAILASMENPYDFVARDRLMEASDESLIWDCAYYDGKYYVYFGVVPVMLFYFPWYLITGTAFPTWLGILISGVAFVVFAFLLSAKVAKKYFDNKIPYVAWLLSTLLAINGCGVNLIMRRPDFYSLPILLGITLSLAGIYLWIDSIKDNGVNGRKLIIGCLCMALVAGCRPQLMVGSLLIFPIYWDAVFHKRWLFSKEGKWKTAGAVLAYVLVACLLMVYNYKRFDSPFDFGANYNLTTNDMTRRGWEWARIPGALFRYLVQLPNISMKFPYLQITSDWTSYIGKTISEGTFGGFFTMNLIPLIGIGLLRCKEWFVSKKIWITCVMLNVLGMVVVCLDAQMAGILLRYFCDFGWIFYLAGLLAWFSAWQYNSHRQERVGILRLAQNVAFCIGMAFAFLILFVDNGESLIDANARLFYELYYQLAFWA